MKTQSPWQIKYDILYTYVLSFFAFGINYFDRLIPYLIGLWILALIIRIFYLKSFRLNRIALFRYSGLLIYMLVSILSVLWSDNQHSAFMRIETRLSLLIIPLLHLFQPSVTVNKKWIVYSFITGIISFSILNLILFLIRGFQEEEWFFRWTLQAPVYMFHTYFSPFKHSSYWALNLLIGMTFLTEYYRIHIPRLKNYLFFGILLMMFSFILVSGSRSAIILAFLLLTYTLIWFTFSENNHRLYRWVILIPVILFILLINVNERFTGRAGSSVESVNVISSDSRISQWKYAFILIKQNPVIGVGIGDVTEELSEVYKDNNFIKGSVKKLNTHNQFFESQLESGLLGTVSLLFIILLPFFHKERRRLKFLVFSIFCGMMMFECILNRIAGISLFLLLYLVFTYEDNQNKNALKQTY